MSGLRAAPTGTLVDRTLQHLSGGPADSMTLATQVLGIAQSTRVIADRVVVALLGADPRVRQLADARWALVDDRAERKSIAEATFAVVDIEATGSLATKGDRIIEIAVVTMANGKIGDVFESLVNPGRPVPRFVRHLTSITDEMLQDQPRFTDIADAVLTALAGRVFVAHNAQFDWRFVTTELRRATGMELDGPRLCTLRLARRLMPELRSRGLDSLATYFGIPIHGRHRAGGDAMATAQLLGRLLEIAAERGADTLDDLEHLARKRRRRRTAMPTVMTEL